MTHREEEGISPAASREMKTGPEEKRCRDERASLLPVFSPFPLVPFSLLPEEEQKILCEHTALTAASWYADSNEFSENLDVLETAYSSGAEKVVVSLLRSEYENAAV